MHALRQEKAWLSCAARLPSYKTCINSNRLIGWLLESI